MIDLAPCGVCRTDLHIFDGELEGAQRFALGDRLGVPWLASTCGHCEYCASGRENLCGGARG